MGRNIDRVHTFFRGGTVTADSFYLDYEFVKGRHAAARHTDHGSSLDILGDNGSDMGSEHCVNAVHGSLRANPLSPLGAFLIRLEEQPYRSRNLVLVFI